MQQLTLSLFSRLTHSHDGDGDDDGSSGGGARGRRLLFARGVVPSPARRTVRGIPASVAHITIADPVKK